MNIAQTTEFAYKVLDELDRGAKNSGQKVTNKWRAETLASRLHAGDPFGEVVLPQIQPPHLRFRMTWGHFEVGQKYLTQEGKIVTIVASSTHTDPYSGTVKGDDDIYRYDRGREIDGDRGRVTGTDHDWTYPKNLVWHP